MPLTAEQKREWREKRKQEAEETRLIGTQRGRFVNAKSASQEAPMHSLDRKRSEYDCIR